MLANKNENRPVKSTTTTIFKSFSISTNKAPRVTLERQKQKLRSRPDSSNSSLQHQNLVNILWPTQPETSSLASKMQHALLPRDAYSITVLGKL